MARECTQWHMHRTWFCIGCGNYFCGYCKPRYGVFCSLYPSSPQFICRGCNNAWLDEYLEGP